MADAPSSMIDFLMRTIQKLEADVALKDARIRELQCFLEGLSEGFQESACDAEQYFQLMDGPAQSNG